MAAAEVDAIVTWAPISVRYLTGYWCWIAPLLKAYMVGSGRGDAAAMRNVAVLPHGGRPILIVDALWAPDTLGTDVEDIRVVGERGFELQAGDLAVPEEFARVLALVPRRSQEGGPFEILAEFLRESSLDSSRIAVDLAGAQPRELDELRALVPQAELLDATSMLRLIRAVKTEAEVECLRTAAAISETAALSALRTAGAGTSTIDVASRYREAVGSAGADFDHFAFGPYGIGLVTEARAELRAGDALYADFGLVYNGWFADSGTTLIVGEVTAAAEREHAAVRDCVAAGASALRPGRKVSLVQAAMQEALADAGITKSFPHGHGVGLEVRDYPVIVPDSGLVIKDGCVELGFDLELEPGMVVNLEAPFFTLGRRSVHCEQTFVIADNGCEPLVTQDRDAPIRAEATASG